MWTNSRKLHNNGFRGSTYSSSVPYNLNVWHRYALRYVNDEYQFFIDNNIVHTQNAAGGLARGSGGQIGIGAREDGVEKANADFGVVRLYKRALTDDEMTLNFGFDKGRFGK
mmetsp:Transcript_20639/g.46140  ORF Transcript_20639/g.46140 Transcript_20639/m.46140 type:complete len:112 (-) Transcript_20639:1982-2317(-)|eukprot:CAMPEP_0181258412 /NCGR_PEP_ID=MMETSP1096-20121128/50768_1 /TAXON_ID=156174 ORGANISM="Chrysochromulina ericina, Strain CCMP281" /NCGR_SAMPLE_ID=MMETSP1096 /ASSEMBLY_ACC=CAM_ASM_000453 /LENGTH=111 /DNA_ID=CAMNT_0023356803 /DNA_START=475 /DNA_END=810 /DNA_ORIENTATION=+